ncbi:acetyl-CoA synthetase [Candidatus Woesearchaeota archaeon]|nr:acetyl-CoA synthetase [Candidatus Woesearchaeota archaeon]
MPQLNFNRTKKIIDKYKLPFARSFLIKSSEEAVKRSKELGFPVAMKISSPDIIHKSDAGCVAAEIKDEDHAKKAYEDIIKNAKKKKAKIEGVIVQKNISGVEAIIGMKSDPQFGPVILFGMGGIFVEIFEDISLRIAPIDKKIAEEMIDEIRSSDILKGARGREPVNIKSLKDILVKISNLSMENKKLESIDLNPVIVDKKTAKIVDARMMEYEK